MATVEGINHAEDVTSRGARRSRSRRRTGSTLALATLVLFPVPARSTPPPPPREAAQRPAAASPGGGPGATRLKIQVVANEGTSGALEIRLDGGAAVTKSLTGKERSPVVLEVDFPPGVTGFEVGARLTVVMANGTREPGEARKRFRIQAPGGPVFGGGGTFDPAAAFRDFLKAEGLGPGAFEDPRPEPAAALDAAEKRLGFRLHPDHRALLSRLGPLRADDFFMVEAARLDLAARQLGTLWGDEARRAEVLPADVRALLGRSTMVLVEAGDGYSALLYERGDPGTLWRMTQGSYQPKKLEDDGGRPLSFRAALGRALSRMSELYLPSDGRPPRIEIRSGRPNTFFLTIDRFGGELVLDLVPE